MQEPLARDERVARTALARAPVFGAMIAQGILLLLVSDRYGYHRDELYFRLLRPAWGYVDQPPLTPLVARATRVLIVDEPWALRLPAMLAAAGSVLLVALVTREVGGGRGAQALAAWGFAFAAFTLVVGHTLLTASLDAPAWIAVLWLVIRASLRHEDRWWLVAGVVTGVAFSNKLLVVVLLAALAGGLLLTGPRRSLVSRPVLVGIATAIVIGLPNVIYQATNGWPQLEFGRTLAEHNASDVRAGMWPLLALLLGPPLTVVWIAGVVALFRRVQWRPIRFVAAALPVLLALVFIMGTQPYYPFGLVAVLYAVGCVPMWEWLRRRHTWRAIGIGLVAVNAVIDSVIALPLIPLSHLGATPIPGINQGAADTVGWPTYVRQVAAVVDRLPADDRASAVIVASNYGEAGAMDRFGGPDDLRVYSAQNALYYGGRPPRAARVAVVVGGQVPQASQLFESCRTVARLDNGVDVDNEEQGQPIAICHSPLGGWTRVWPELKHED